MNLLYKHISILIILFFLFQSNDLYGNHFSLNKVNELNDYLRQCKYLTNNDKVLTMTDSIINIAREYHDIEIESQCLLIQGEYYYNSDDLPKMKDILLKLQKIASNTESEDMIFVHWNRIIDYYLYKFNYVLMINEIKSYQRKALLLNNRYAKGYVYLKWGDAYFSQQKYNQAIIQYNKGLDYFISQKESKYFQEFYLYLSSAYFNINNFKESKKYVLKSIEESKRVPSEIAMLSLCNARLGLWDETESNLKEIEKMAKEYPFSSSTYNNLNAAYTLYYQHQKLYDKALEHALAITNKSLRYYYLQRLYKAKGDFKKALSYAELNIGLNDSINSLQTDRLVEDYSAQYDIEYLKSEKIQEELKRKNQIKNISWIIVISVLIFFIIQTILLRKAKCQRIIAEKASSELKKAKEIAEQAQRKAENADKLKSLFLQNMSHEIRTPLNAIVGFTQVLNSDDVEYTKTEKEEFLKIINSNTELLTTLINDILDLSKLESGNYKVNYSKVSVKDLCVKAFKSVEGHQNEGVMMQIKPPYNETLLINGDKVDDIKITTDCSRVQQVLVNFLTNACKYTQEGEIVLSYDIRKSCYLQSLYEIVFEVRDTGKGIDKSAANLIFQRFEKLGSFKPGTGLGLNISSHIARILKGKVMLDTSYEKGAKFLFILPLDC